jgi:hypothetical protein
MKLNLGLLYGGLSLLDIVRKCAPISRLIQRVFCGARLFGAMRAPIQCGALFQLYPLAT